MSVHTAYRTVEWKPAGSWIDITNKMIRASGTTRLQGNRANAFAFGVSVEPDLTLETFEDLASDAWEFTPVRASFGLDTSAVQAIAGVILRRGRQDARLVFQAAGWKPLLERCKVYSPLLIRRPVATKTGPFTVEDPSSPSWRGGLINYIFWHAGGRPAEQAGIFLDAPFFYRCDQAVLTPEFSWVAGENAYEELLRLAAASGGQIYQAPDGSMCYRQPFGIADGTAAYTFDESVYAEISEDASAELTATGVVCNYIPRQLRGMQEVLRDTTARFIPAGESITLNLEPQWPCRSYDLKTASTLPDDGLHLTYPHSVRVTPGSSDYSHSVSTSAQRITLTITNNTSQPLILYQVLIRGEPVVGGEAISVTAGVTTGDEASVLRLEDNPYIQTFEHASRLNSMALAFYGSARPTRSLRGCPYDQARTIGETVLLTRSRWGIVAAEHVIVGISHESGLTASYDLVPTAGLPRTSQFFTIGPNYAGITRKLGY